MPLLTPSLAVTACSVGRLRLAVERGAGSGREHRSTDDGTVAARAAVRCGCCILRSFCRVFLPSLQPSQIFTLPSAVRLPLQAHYAYHRAWLLYLTGKHSACTASVPYLTSADFSIFIPMLFYYLTVLSRHLLRAAGWLTSLHTAPALRWPFIAVAAMRRLLLLCCAVPGCWR